jgi:hypothetical protein
MSLAHKMWALDPGYFKVKSSIKTTVGLAIALLITYNFLGKMPAVLSGLAAIFATQGLMDDPWKKRLGSLIITGACSLFAYLAGALLKPHVLTLEMLLVVLAFFALYVRRFGPRFMIPPINVWAMCLAGGILPHEPAYLIFQNGLAYIIGLFSAWFVYFAIFPLNKRHLYYANIDQMKDVFVESLLWLEQYFINGVPGHTFLEKNRKLFAEIVKLVTINESILEGMTNANLAEANKFAKNQVICYALQKDFSILFEGFSGLMESRMEVAKELKQLLLSTFLHLGFLIQQIKVDPLHERIQIDKSLIPFEDYLEKIRGYLNTCRVDQKEEFIPVLNICLGLQLIWRNLW